MCPLAQIYCQLLDLDRQLQAQAQAIASQVDLSLYRRTLKPDPSAWWWFLEVPPKPKRKSDRFGWVWNGLTVVFLVSATSFATSTAKAFSEEGFDILGIFSSFTQGAGLALVAGGTFTDKGRKTVQNVLESVDIPKHFHAEATCLFSASLLLASATIYANLDRFGTHYYRWGQRDRRNGDNVMALRSYQKALNFSPSNRFIYAALGQLSEDMGQLEDAQAYYEQGIALSDAISVLGLGRVTLLNALQEVGWTAKVDDTTLRQVEFLFELAGQFNVVENADGGWDEEIDVVIEQHLHFGLMELATVDLEALTRRSLDTLDAEARSQVAQDREHLQAALDQFQIAHLEELKLLTLHSTKQLSELILTQLDRPIPESDLRLAVDDGLSRLTTEEQILVLEQALDSLPEAGLADAIDGAIEKAIFELGKPRCYRAITQIILRALPRVSSAPPLQPAPSGVNTLSAVHQQCGGLRDDGTFYLHTVDLNTLNIYDKTLVRKLLDIAEQALEMSKAGETAAPTREQ